MTTEDEAILHAQHTHQHRTPRKRGTTLVAIEGIDGTGKTTLARNLATLLGAQHISFPDRTPGTPTTQLIAGGIIATAITAAAWATVSATTYLLGGA